jgi:cytochrome c oxidase subunit 1
MTRMPLTIWAFFCYSNHWGSFVSCFIIRCFIIDNGQKFGTSFFLSDIYIAGEF